MSRSMEQRSRFDLGFGTSELAAGDWLGGTKFGFGLDNARISLNDSGRKGITSEAGNVVNTEFVHEPLTMFLDGFVADAEFDADLFVAITAGDEAEHLQFPMCNICVSGTNDRRWPGDLFDAGELSFWILDLGCS